MDEPPDIVRDILERVAKLDPSFTPEMAEVVEIAVRQKWGGLKSYVSLARVREYRAAKVRDEFGRMSAQEIEQRHGVSRATIYRLWKRGRK